YRRVSHEAVSRSPYRPRRSASAVTGSREDRRRFALEFGSREVMSRALLVRVVSCPCRFARRPFRARSPVEPRHHVKWSKLSTAVPPRPPVVGALPIPLAPALVGPVRHLSSQGTDRPPTSSARVYQAPPALAAGPGSIPIPHRFRTLALPA